MIFPKKLKGELKLWEVTFMNKIHKQIEATDKAFDLPFETRMVMYRFLSEIDRLAEENDLNKKQLAALIETSPSFITQLYRGGKILNLETIAKFQHIFDGVFDVQFKPRNIRPQVKDNSNQAASNNIKAAEGYGNTVFMNDAPLMYVVKDGEKGHAA